MNFLTWLRRRTPFCENCANPHLRFEREMDKEIRFHLDSQICEYLSQGLNRDEAERRARRDFGPVELAKDECRDAVRLVWLDHLWRDLRLAIRTVRRSPGFALAAIVTLALGIGANTAIFNMVNSMLLRPLPVKDPSQIAALVLGQNHDNLQNLASFSIANYRDIRQQSAGAFSELFCHRANLDGLDVNGKAERVLNDYVSGNYFSALGLQPALGRLILPLEGEAPGADPVLVLGYSFWKTRFASDPNIVGKQVLVDGHPVTIVGVAPKGFHGTYPLVDLQGYLPMGMLSITGAPSDFMTNRTYRNFAVLGRLAPDSTFGQAQSSLAVVASRLSRQYPDTDKDLVLNAFPELRARPNPDPKNTMTVISGLFLGLSALVLVLACVNVANLLLVRGSVREREMAIRASLGASRSRLVGQLLTESVLLATGGGIVGVLLGLWSTASLASIDIGIDLPLHLDFGFDWRTFVYASLAALLAGIVAGIAPAMRALHGNPRAIPHEGGRGVAHGKNRLRSVLVIAQVAGSLMLLIIAGLFTRGLSRAQTTDLGFEPRNVLNISMNPNEIGYKAEQARQFYKNLLDRVRALPGVESASTAISVPMGYYAYGDRLEIQGYQSPAGQPSPTSMYNVVSTDYFNTMRIPIVRGRLFTAADDDKTQYVAIISEKMAKRFWSSQDPIGRKFKIGGDPGHWIQVVGIAKDSRFQGATGPIGPFFFLPFEQHHAMKPHQTLQVRTAATPAAVISEVEGIIRNLAPELPLYDVKTMTEALYTLNGLLIFQIGAGLSAGLGILGLILALVGVYGVVSYAAEQRTHEIGIRMALGAQPAGILTLILRQGLLVVGVGVVLGMMGALAVGRLLGNFLSGVSPSDPFTYATVSFILSAVALLACYIPAHRTVRIDPVVALRHE